MMRVSALVEEQELGWKVGPFGHSTNYRGCEVVSWANTSIRKAETAISNLLCITSLGRPLRVTT